MIDRVQELQLGGLADDLQARSVIEQKE